MVQVAPIPPRIHAGGQRLLKLVLLPFVCNIKEAVSKHFGQTCNNEDLNHCEFARKRKDLLRSISRRNFLVLPQ
jgi:hypothetical protein